jgi:hypothetical protein
MPRFFVAIVDLLIVVAIAVTLTIIISGGIRGRIAGVPVSAHNPERHVVAAVVLLLVRWRFARHAGPFGSAAGTYARVFGRLVARDADLAPGTDPSAASRRVVIAALGYCAVAGLMLHTQLRQMDAVPDLGDPIFSMWRIGWVYLQLLGDPRGLFDANIFHPEPLTLTFSDSMLLTSLMAAPLLGVGVAPAVTYNVLMVASFLLSAVATYLLVIRLTGSARAAFVAGLLYGFHPFRFEHYSHLELQMTYWMPLGLLALHRFIETRQVRHAVLAALCTAAQLYSSMYFAVFFLFYAAAVFATVLVVQRRPVLRLIGPLALAGLVAAALALPLARPYAAAQSVKGDRPLTEVDSYSAKAADYFRAHHRSALYGGRLLPPEFGERALFPGLMLLVLAAAALVPPIGPLRAAYLAGLLVAFDLSMGLNGVLYEPLYNHFSPMRGMRVAARASVVAGISLAVLSAFAVRALLSRCSTDRMRSVVFAGIVVAAILDLRPVLTLQPVWSTPPPIYTAVAGRTDVVLAEFPFRAVDRRSGPIDALPQMYFSIWHGRPMVNGYSGFFPPSYDPLLETIGWFPEPSTLSMFRSRGVTHITITCALTHDKPGCDGLLDKVESSPAFRQVAAGRWEGYPARLYQLLPP